MGRAWLFPGQGSQRPGMGRAELERHPDAARRASEVLGWDVRAQLLEGAEPGLRSTAFVQPALFLVGALAARTRLDAGERPDFLAGHSLGEYAALYAAGCFDLETGLRLVAARGELMARADGGSMLAIIDADIELVSARLRGPQFADVDIANRNSATQVVLAGSPDALARAAEAVGTAGRAVPLRVSAAFHSRQMAGVAEEFAQVMTAVELHDPCIPVVANVTARPYPPGQLAELLVRQIAGTVLWWESMSWLRDRGVTDIVDLGPGQVVTDLWRSANQRPYGPVAPPPAESPPAESPLGTSVTPETLGAASFRRDYGVRYAYAAGSMYRGIASVEMVDRLGQAGLLGFFGAGGLELDEIDEALHRLTASLGTGGRFGVNLLARPDAPEHEVASVELFLRHGVRHVEAAAFTQVTPAVVRFRFSGAHIAADGTPLAVRHVVAKVSRPEVASAFMSPPPEGILDALLRDGRLTAAEAAAARGLPVAGDICAEADSGGHTDAANAFALVPAMTRLRDRMMTRHRYPVAIRVGAAGGIGSPEAAAAAFVLGADFVITGSVNQCTPEAGTSDAVKDLLSGIDVQDTTYAPAGDLFELGARVQVVRRGTLFAARANKLYSLYRQVPDLDAIDPETLHTIEERYFHRSVRSIWADLQATAGTETLEQGRRNGKARMAMIFRWYFGHSTRAAMVGSSDVADYQVHCGPAMGAFNRVVEGTDLEPWRERHVEAIAELIMSGAARALDVTSRTGGRR